MEAKKRFKLAVGRGATCSGCDIAILDIHEKLLDVAKKAEVVYAPTIMDAKDSELEAIEDESIDVGIFHGSIRLSENEQLAKLLRQKSKKLVALGACACFGGIFGLANTTSKEEIFDEVYGVNAENSEGIKPQETSKTEGGNELTLPAFYDEVFALDDKVRVDYYIPSCPPVSEQIIELLSSIFKGKPPKDGKVFASDRTLCSECPRTKSKKRRIDTIYRVHEIEINQEKCMLDQGILCMGPATRGGCKAICLKANVPCRGCNGPTKEAFDQGGNILGLFATIFGIGEEELTEEDVRRIFSQIKDPLGTFYRFTLPKSILKRVRKKER